MTLTADYGADPRPEFLGWSDGCPNGYRAEACESYEIGATPSMVLNGQQLYLRCRRSDVLYDEADRRRREVLGLPPVDAAGVPIPQPTLSDRLDELVRGFYSGLGFVGLAALGVGFAFLAYRKR